LARPFSLSVCKTIAVEDIDSARPLANAACHEKPAAIRATKNIKVVPPNCKAPVPTINFRIRHRFVGSSSRPIKKSIMTTPNSAKCIISLPSSPTKPRKNGPIIMPPNRYPRTDPIPSFFAIGTKIIAVAR